MADTFTPNFNLTKPEVGGSRDSWGTKDNANLDAIDAALKNLKDQIAAVAAKPAVPPGTIAFFGMNTPPDGWLKCNGASLSRTAYAALFAAIGATYGAADGNSFSVPDIRGYFPRALDDGRGVDPGRGLNAIQGDMFGSHNHPPSNSGVYITGYGAGVGGANVASGSYLQIDNSQYAGGNETRPKNIAFPMFIKT